MLRPAERRRLLALHRRKARETEGLFLVEGVRVVEELVAAPIDLEFAVAATTLGDSARGAALLARLQARTPVHEVKEHELKQLAATDQPQGVVVVARAPEPALGNLVLAARSVVLIADGVQDPGNLGTLIRIADAFAADAVITLPNTVDRWSPKTVRASAGSSFHLPIVATTIEELRTWAAMHQVDVVGAAAEGAPAEQVRFAPRVALLAGNEGAGLSAGAREITASLVSVSMPGRAESLNVAVACGILMYVLSRR